MYWEREEWDIVYRGSATAEPMNAMRQQAEEREAPKVAVMRGTIYCYHGTWPLPDGFRPRGARESVAGYERRLAAEVRRGRFGGLRSVCIDVYDYDEPGFVGYHYSVRFSYNPCKTTLGAAVGKLAWSDLVSYGDWQAFDAVVDGDSRRLTELDFDCDGNLLT